jgi:glutaredoxin-like protein NrdH
MALKHIPGKNLGYVVLYALSTCPWCKKTKKLLDDMGAEYYYADVDLMAAGEKDKTMRIIEKWNPSCSFPTLVINDNICIVGFQEDEIRKALKL